MWTLLIRPQLQATNTLQVGARGVPDLPGFTCLAQFLEMRKKDFLTLLHDTTKAAITGSVTIWCYRTGSSSHMWLCPRYPLVSFPLIYSSVGALYNIILPTLHHVFMYLLFFCVVASDCAVVFVYHLNNVTIGHALLLVIIEDVFPQHVRTFLMNCVSQMKSQIFSFSQLFCN